MSEMIYRTKLYEDVSQKLLDRIRGEIWLPGSRIPSEPELAVEFDVSRSTIREAIRSLRFMGVLTAKGGSGTYVTENALTILQAQELTGILLNPEHIRDLVQSRYILEPELAALAARRASAEEKRELLALVQEMEAQTDRTHIMQLGHKFHLTLVKIAHNPILHGFYRSIASQLRAMRVLESLTLEVYLDGVKDHKLIAQAISEGNSALAEAKMREHLEKDYRTYLDHVSSPSDSI